MMAYTNSKLVSYTKLSPNYSTRTGKITKITIHHAAVVNASLVGLGNGFNNPNRRASSNYGIDSNGRIGMYVEEKNRAWTSSSSANDNVAVTIEVANDGGAPDWHVSDKALAALIDLCVDICKRNDIKELNYTGNASGNLTKHSYFANTLCPGPYLGGRFSYIAEEVNKRLKPTTPVTNNNLATKEVSVNLKVLQKGAKGEQVKTLQRLLIGSGYVMKNGTKTYGVDGSFGTATENAVKAFQKARKLSDDGIVGKATWAALLGV
jgi:N-acetyl-anhydromuramyl-L-alanine amidase AmpD